MRSPSALTSRSKLTELSGSVAAIASKAAGVMEMRITALTRGLVVRSVVPELQIERRYSI
jgi:hypothetical protein